MKAIPIKRPFLAALLLLPVLTWAQGQELRTIKLNEPNKTRGLPVMQALSVRASVRDWSDKDFSLQDLSDLLWAAGDYRNEIGMRPGGGPGGAPRAKPEGSPPTGTKPEGPPGAKPGGPQSTAPILLVLVSDISRFGGGTPELKKEWGAIDTGIVSQNISLFCAATGMATRPRAGMNHDRIKELLKLKDTQYAMLNHPIGYPKKAG